MVDSEAVSTIPLIDGETEEKIPLNTEKPVFPPPEEVARVRAAKADIAMGEHSPGQEVLVNSILAGTEEQYRKHFAVQKGMADYQERVKMIRSLSKVGQLTPETQEQIRALSEHRLPDDSTVWENGFSNQVVNGTMLRWMNSIGFGEKVSKDPETVHTEADVLQTLLERQQWYKKEREDLEARVSAQGWGEYLLNIGKLLVPFWSDINLHNAVKMPKFGSIATGTNVQEQAMFFHTKLWNEDTRNLYRATIKELEALNPLDAVTFARAIEGFSTNEQFLNDVFFLANFAMFPSAKGGKTVAAGRQMTTMEIERARLGLSIAEGTRRGEMTVTSPRAMTSGEIARAGEGLGTTPGPSELTPQAIDKMKKAFPERPGTVTEPRNMTPGELAVAKEGASYVEGPARFLTNEELAEIQNSFKQVMQVFDLPNPKVETYMAAVGDLKSAGKVSAVKTFQNITTGQAPSNLAELSSKIPSIFSVEQVVKDPGSLSQEQARRVLDSLLNNAGKLIGTFEKVARPSRLPQEAIEAALQVAEADARADKTFGRAVLDIAYDYQKYPNTHTALVNLGTTEATLFPKADSARFAAKVRYKLGNEGDAWTVEQRGDGWFIQLVRPLPETAEAVRAMLIPTENQAPVTFANMFFGRLRSADDLTSRMNTEQRKLITHAQQRLHEAMEEVAQKFSKGFGKLSKTEYSNLLRMHELDRSFSKDGVQGRAFKTVGDFERAYVQTFGKTPSEKELVGYFSFRQVHDLDWMMRSLGLARDMIHQGVQEMKVVIRHAETETNPAKKVISPSFYGKKTDDLPSFHENDFGVYVIDKENEAGKFYHSRDISDFGKQDIADKLKKDYKVIQLFRPMDRPLSEAFNEGNFIHFIVTNDYRASPVGWDVLPYRDGIHRVYSDPWTVKQGNVAYIGGRRHFIGDNVVLGASTEAEANRWSAALEQARKLYNNKLTDELVNHVAKNLPHELLPGQEHDIIKKFASRIWDPEEPFVTKASGRSVAENADFQARHRGFINEADSPFNLSKNVNKEFLASRDEALFAFKERGTDLNPAIQIETAKMLDIMPTLHRAMSDAAHSYMYNDYRIFSAESFVQQFADTLRVTPDKLKRNPLYYLSQPVDKIDWSRDPALTKKVAAAKNSLRAIQNFLGMETPDTAALKTVQHKLLNGIYKTLGQDAADFVSTRMLPTVTDPTRFLRSAAFDLKIGFFSPAQFLVQLQTLTHVASVTEPRHVLPGMSAGFMTRLALMRPDDTALINKIGGILEKTSMGAWTKNNYREALEALDRSGWHLVQGETAWRDNIIDMPLVKTSWGKFVNGGRIFFQEGERFSRLAAWMTSYLEWRAANPNAVLDDKALALLLNRSDTKNVNMTRSSTSSLQAGLQSLTTQFWSYQQRLFEQMIGGRLSVAEKARVMIGYSMMYGIPAAAGAAGINAVFTKGDIPIPVPTFGMWPVHDSIRQEAIERHVDLENPFIKTLIEGLPSYLVGAVLGKDYNIAGRLSPQGNPAIRDVLHDGDWLGFITGASGSVLNDVIRTGTPLYHSIVSAVSGQGNTLVPQDFLDLAKNISSVSYGVRAYYAAMYGTYMTRSESVVVRDADTLDAVMTAAFGLTRQDVSDAWSKVSSMATREAAQKNAEKEVSANLRRFLDAKNSGDDKLADTYLRKVQMWVQLGGFNQAEHNQLIQRALANNHELIDQIGYRFAFPKAPPDQAEGRQKRFLGSKSGLD